MINLDDIAPAFSFVSSKGFVLTENSYTPHEFGDAVLIMKGALFSLRFTRDRGQIFIDAGNDIVGWYRLEDVFQFVNDTSDLQQDDISIDFSGKATFAQRHWENIVCIFRNPKKLLQLRVLSEQKSAARLKKMYDRK